MEVELLLLSIYNIIESRENRLNTQQNAWNKSMSFLLIAWHSAKTLLLVTLIKFVTKTLTYTRYCMGVKEVRFLSSNLNHFIK